MLPALAACGGGDDEAAPAEPTTAAATTEDATDTQPADTAGELGGDPVAGESVWQEAGCGNCHTLEAAGSSGGVGPNLDDAQPSFEVVVERVTNGGGGMPAFGDGVLDEQQIQDVAAYVVQSTQGS